MERLAAHSAARRPHTFIVWGRRSHFFLQLQLGLFPSFKRVDCLKRRKISCVPACYNAASTSENLLASCSRRDALTFWSAPQSLTSPPPDRKAARHASIAALRPVSCGRAGCWGAAFESFGEEACLGPSSCAWPGGPQRPDVAAAIHAAAASSRLFRGDGMDGRRLLLGP